MELRLSGIVKLLGALLVLLLGTTSTLVVISFLLFIRHHVANEVLAFAVLVLISASFTTGVLIIRIFRLHRIVYYSVIKSARRPWSKAGGLLDPLVFPLWVVPSILGWIIVLRRSNGIVASDWMTAPAYRLHKGLVALSTLMIVLNYASQAMQKLLLLRKNELDTDKPPSSASSDAESIIEKPQQMYLIPEPRESDKERWLQRRNSLSSQRAIYPSNSRAFEPGRSATMSYTPSSRYSRTLGSSSFDYIDRTLSFTSTPSSFSSASTMRGRYGQPDPNCPAIPESPKLLEHFPQPPSLPAPPPPPPPAWCPPLDRAPLSADPAIRALSTNSGDRLLRPPSSRAPTLPRRAPGHGVGRLSSGTRLALQRPSPIGYQRKRLWTYRAPPSMYSESSYGTRGSTPRFEDWVGKGTV